MPSGWARGIVATSQHSTQEITRDISAEAAVHGSINDLLTFLDHVRPIVLFKKFSKILFILLDMF
jgi:hypothetical protein